MNRPGCYDLNGLFKPQFAYDTPDDSRDEIFLIPVQFRILADGKVHLGFPWQLDDDVPFWLHGIVFPQIAAADGFVSSSEPALCRITDTQGNPLSDGLVLSLGVWANSGDQNVNAFGFPIEPAVECAPGGALIFDFQLNNNGAVAFLQVVGIVEVLTITALNYGTAGNSIHFAIVNGGALSVAVVGTVITVTINTGTTTYQDVADALNASAAVLALVTVTLAGITPTELATAFADAPLAGGTASSVVTLNGTLIGVKRFPKCL